MREEKMGRGRVEKGEKVVKGRVNWVEKLGRGGVKRGKVGEREVKEGER